MTSALIPTFAPPADDRLVAADDEFRFWATVQALVKDAGHTVHSGTVIEQIRGKLDAEWGDVDPATIRRSWRLTVRVQYRSFDVYGTDANAILASLRSYVGSPRT
jgi:hypothetical protein